jgi:hypothetical protein
VIKMFKISSWILLCVLISGLSAQITESENSWYEIVESSGTKVIKGDITPEVLWSHFPDWRKEYQNYQPDSLALQKMKAFSDSCLIICVLGSWCADSRMGVPAFLKAVDLADNPLLQLHLIAVDRSKQVNSHFFPDVKVNAVPTFVISCGGKEIGRMIEFPRKTFETDFVELIHKNL